MSAFPRFAITTITLAFLGASAHAADLPSKKQSPPSPTPVANYTNWTGVYGGFNAGFATGNYTKDGPDIYGHPSGGSFGLTGGYNYQMPSNWVVGVEGDVSASTIGGSDHGSSETPYLNTFRARLGYALDDTLPYVTAGYAGGTTSDRYNGSSKDHYHNGYTIGAGVEKVITGPWTAKAEALFVHLDERSIPTGAGSSGADMGLFRIGLNYHF